MTALPAVEVEPVRAIAEDVFAAMVDGEPGLLLAGAPEVPALVDPIHAWVDVRGPQPVRVAVVAEQATAEHVTRALLRLSPAEALTDDDVRDGLGEVANVVGGNVKALVGAPTGLTLPAVAPHAPADDDAWSVTHELVLDWRGRTLLLVVSEGRPEPHDTGQEVSTT